MANKKIGDEEIDLDNFDLDDFDFDIPEFEDPDPSTDDRTPVAKLADGFKKGVTAGLTSPDTIKRSIGQALPRGYAQAINVFDAADDTARELYNSVAKDIAPITDGARAAAAKISPKIRNKLPKALQEKLENFATGGSSGENYSAKKLKQESEDSQIASAMSELFQQQAQQNNEILVAEKADAAVRDAIDARRHGEAVDQMSVVAQGVSRLVGYQDNILTKYQQKSLELQYRHYFVAKDLLDITAQGQEKLVLAMDKIVKNTALPEAVKIQQSEMASQMLKERMLSSTFNNIANWTRDYRENLTNNVKSYVGGIAGSFSGAKGDVEMLTDQFGKAGGAGYAAGMALGDTVADAVSTRAAPYLDKIPGLRKFGAKMGNLITSAPKQLNRWSKSETEGDGIKATLTQVLKDVMPKYYLDDTIKTSGVMDSDQPAVFDNLTRRSIVEIIPGWLEQINRWVKATATGKLDSEEEMSVYNLEKGKFTSRKDLMGDIKRRIMPRGETDSYKIMLNDFVKDLTDEGGLSDGAVKALKMKLTKDLAGGEMFDPESLTKREFYAGMDDAFVDELRYFFKGKFGVGIEGIEDDSVENIDRIGDFQARFNSLESSLPNAGDYVKNLYDVYGRDNIQRMGLASRQGNKDVVNYDNIWGSILNDDDISQDRGPGDTINPNGPKPAGPNNIQELIAEQLKNLLGQRQDVVPPPAPAQDAGLDTASLDRFETFFGRDSLLIQEIMGLRRDTTANNISELVNQNSLILQEISLKMDSMGCGGQGENGEPVDRRGLLRRNLGALKTGLKGGLGRAGKLGKGYLDATMSFYKGVGTLGMGAVKGGWGAAKLMASPAWSTAKTVGGGILTAGKGYLGAVGSLYKGAGTAAMGIGKSALETAGGFGRGLLGRVEAGKAQFIEKMLKTGEYFDSITQKPIKSLKDLKGDLVDRFGKPVNMDELAEQGKSLMGVAGEKLGSGTNWMAGKAVNLGVGAAKLYGKALMLPFKAAAWAFNKLKGKFGGGSPSKSFKMSGNGENDLITLNYHQLTIQEQILQFIKSNFGNKKTGGDSDGDGDRDGSWKDILKNREKKKEDEKNAALWAASARGNGSGVGMGAGGITAAMRRYMDKKRGEETEEDDGSLLDDAASAAEIADFANGDGGDRGGRRGGRLSRLGGRLKNWGGKALKVGGKALGVAGIGYGAYSAATNLAEGNYGEAALDTGLTLGGIALMGGGGALMTGATAIGGALATGVGAILGSPVLLAGAAAAAVGYGAYKLYKHFADRPSPLAGIRYAQYGIDPREAEEIGPIVQLEEMLMKHVQYTEEGARISGGQVDSDAILKLFGIDSKNEDHLERAQMFLTWLRQRFMPVFITHVSTLHKLAKDVKLSEIDAKLPVNLGLDYIKATKCENMAASFDDTDTSPFDDDLTSDADDVEDWIEDAIEHYEDAMEGQPKEVEKSTSKASESAKAAIGAAGAAAAGVTASGPKSGGGGGAGISGATKATTGAGFMGSLKDLGAGISDGLAGTGALAGKALGYTPLGMMFNLGWDNIKSVKGMLFADKKKPKVTLDALTAGRYKVYGLVELDLDKVESLYTLEDAMWNDVKYDGKTAYYDGKPDAIYSVVKDVFKVAEDDEDHRTQWFNWFKFRYLPVFTQLCTAVRQLQAIDARDASEKLSLDEQHEVLVKISSARAEIGKNTLPVWGNTPSPWKDYTLNQDEKSIVGNLEALKTAGKRAGYKEKAAKVADAKSEIEAARRQEMIDKEGAPVAAGGGEEKDDGPGWWSRTMDTVMGGKDQNGERRGGWFGEDIDPNADVSNGTATPLTGGAVIQDHPGGGTGGDVNEIPAPTGKGWAASKATILAAAKMAGFDPHIAATVAAVESGFDPGIKAPTSSAGGYYQFLDATWKETLAKHGKKYGLAANASKYDGRANALMGMEFLKDNASYLKKRLGREISDVDLYTAHFLGPGGASKFLGAPPGADARGWVGEKVPGANHNIFYDKGNRARTVSGVYQEFDRRLKSMREMHDIPAGYKPEETKVDENGNLIEDGVAPPPGVPMSDPEARAKADAAAAAKGTDPAADPVSTPENTQTVGIMAPTTGAKSGAVIAEGKEAAVASGVQPSSATGLATPTPSVSEEYMPTQVAQAAIAQKQSSGENEALNQSMASVTDIMSKQLGVQQSMDGKLSAILEQLQRGSKEPAFEPDRKPGISLPRKEGSNQTTNGLTKPPVDVSRRNVN